MPQLSQQTLASLRQTANTNLNELAALIDPNPQPDGHGGFTPAPLPQGEHPCKLAKVAIDTVEVEGAITHVVRAEFLFAHDCPVREGWQIDKGQESYSVLGVNDSEPLILLSVKAVRL